MSKKNIILSYIKQFLENPIPFFYKRNIDFSFIGNLNIRKVYTIIGPRRAGKSHFCFQIINDLLLSGVDKNNILYFLLENDEIYPLELGDLNIILESYFEITGKINEKVYIFLDEIQEVTDFAKFVRKVLDTYKNIEIVITGSSSKLLSREIDTSLRGRSISYEVFPLSYVEYLNWKNFKSEGILSKSNELILKNLNYNMMKFGLFPEIVIEDNDLNKIKYIKNYYDLIFYRDVVERNNIKSIKKIKSFRKILLSMITNFISINSISKSVGVENNTLVNWLNAFIDSYLFFELKGFSFSVFEIEKSQSKIYTVDTGFYSTIFSGYREDFGVIFENLVFLELRKNGLVENENIFYYKVNNYDIDFIIFLDKKIIPIQVAYEISEKNVNREFYKFNDFLSKRNLKGYVVVFTDVYLEDTFENIEIIKIDNLYKILN